MAKKKPDSKTRPGRGADQFIVRLPPGMRDTLAKWAAVHGRSMNAEIVSALDGRIEFLGSAELISGEGLLQVSKRLETGVQAMEQILTGEDGLYRLLKRLRVESVDAHDVRGLDAFISDQRTQGRNLTQGEAIRTILRAYLEEHGYVGQPERRDREAGGEAGEVTGGDPVRGQFPE
jgi:hypothetical protein